MISLIVPLSLALLPTSTIEADARYGREASQCTSVDVSMYGINAEVLLVNADVVDSFVSVLDNLAAQGLISEIGYVWGTYSNRNVRNYETRELVQDKQSTHTYCLSLDIAPVRGRWTKDFVQVWKDHGWAYGGDFISNPDPIHFSAAPWEMRTKFQPQESWLPELGIDPTGSTYKCPEPMIVTLTTRTWSQIDDDAISRARYTCKKMYTPNECVVKVVRKPHQHFDIICGAKRRVKS